jgi:hypothetical protein
LIREACEKNINPRWADLFNDCVNKFALLEMKNSSRKFTCGDNQENLITTLLDRVFISTCWDNLFPASNVKVKPRLGSDHAPLVVDTGAIRFPPQK